MADPLELPIPGAVVVAGAAGGLGRIIVAELARRSVPVLALVHREPSEYLPATATRICDITDRPAVDEAIEQLHAGHGPIRGLVNAAALQTVTGFAEISADEWSRMMAVNLEGAHNLTRAAATVMAAAGGGAIVHLASIEGHRPAAGHAHYSTSKAGLIHYTRAAAVEFGPVGVRVTTVSPGLCDRPGLAADWPEGVDRWQAASPLGRLVDPLDVANACLFLLSDQAAAITGTDLVVDTGVSARPSW